MKFKDLLEYTEKKPGKWDYKSLMKIHNKLKSSKWRSDYRLLQKTTHMTFANQLAELKSLYFKVKDYPYYSTPVKNGVLDLKDMMEDAKDSIRARETPMDISFHLDAILVRLHSAILEIGKKRAGL